MSNRTERIEILKTKALNAINQAVGSSDDEFGATLFVSHHLEEIAPSYWRDHLGTTQPSPSQVLSMLELRPGMEDEGDDIESLDFTLPCEVTNYVICVRFNSDGEVEEIAMES